MDAAWKTILWQQLGAALDMLEMTRAELLLYDLRHVQHHAAQLNPILRQAVDAAPGWVARAKGTLGS